MFGVLRHRLAIAAVVLMAAAPVQRAAFPALATVAPGRWQLHEIGSPQAPRSLCVADPQVLLQLRHPGAHGCARFVIDNRPRALTVQYTCPGAGQGRTTVSVESPALLRVQTQGIAGGQPFDMDLEARHVGDC